MSAVARLAARVGLDTPLYRALAAARRWSRPQGVVRNARARIAGAPDGLPIPSDGLLHLIGGTPSVPGFLRSGEAAAASIENILAESGHRLEDFGDILDFGCGCGRVLRRWNGRGVHLHGCDYNPKLVKWVRENLPFVESSVNGLLPPLPYAAGSFDFVYGLSVFTHLTEAAQREWLLELRRVLRPGGHLLLTLHGQRHAEWLLEGEELARFRAGESLVVNAELEGSNICAAFHPSGSVGALVQGTFELLAYQEAGAQGNGGQDQYLFKRA
jgi:SAM-dependent methyltransferase